ncbi:MAG: metalloregulator ArsR/SmtB family transcription factor [Pseudohongiellaceae bacterium]
MTTFAILAEPNRRHLLDLLRTGPKPVNNLVQALGMNQPVVSKHLRILKGAGLVSVRAEGQRRLYSLNPRPLAEVDAWLEPYRQFWSGKLDALEQHLDESKGESP